MEIICGSCSAKLSVPDDKLPKGIPVVNANCPKCKYPMEIHIPQPGDAPPPAAEPVPEPAPAPAPAAAATEPPPAISAAAATAAASTPADVPTPAPTRPAPVAQAPRAPEEQPAPPPVAEDFSEDRKFAMVCFADAALTALAKDGLEAAGYSVHLPAKAVDALHWMRRGKYEIVLIHEGFDARFLQTLQPMAMSMRRHMCIGLVGEKLTTMDNMAAFAKSVNFTVAERELDKIKGIARQALADNEQFYRVFREAVLDAGKA